MSNNNPLSQETELKKRSELPRTLGFIITFAGIFFLFGSFFSFLTLVVLRITAGDSDTMSADEIYAAILSFSSILTSLAAIYIGIKLIKYADVGRKFFNIFTVIVIALVLAKYTYKQHSIAQSFANIPPELAANSKGLELSDALSVFILPAILIVVAILLNIKRSRDALV